MIVEFEAGIVIVDDFTSTCGDEDPEHIRLTVDNYRRVIRDTGAAAILIQHPMDRDLVSNYLEREVDTTVSVSRTNNRRRKLTFRNDWLCPITMLPLTFDYRPGTAVPYTPG